MKTSLLVTTSALVSMAWMPSAALAQDAPADADPTSTEIIVTANKRAENIQDVPIAISAVGAKALENSNVKSLQDLTTVVSGYVGPGDLAFQSPHIRGVGSQISSPGNENSVALYVDGVYIGATSPALLRLSSVERVEVLKGPQGTLFGRNTTGGLVHVITRDPGRDFEFSGELGYARFDTVSGSAYLNAPFGEHVATNLAVQASGAGKGWGVNLATGNPTYKLNSEVSVRNKWEFGLGEKTKLVLAGDFESHIDSNYFINRSLVGTKIAPGYTSTVTGWDANSASDVRVESNAWGLSGRLEFDLDFATLSSITAYRKTKFNLLNFTANVAPPGFDDVHFFWNTQNRQFTEELQLTSNGNGPLKWTIGAFYYNATDINHQPGVPGPAGPPFSFVTDSDIKTKSIAVYGQASFEITPQTTLTGGLRYSNDRHAVSGTFIHTPAFFSFLDATSTLQPFSHDSISIRASLSQKLSDDAMIYASYNRGTKSGGFNPVQINNPPYGDEKLDAYEVGTKLTFMDGAGRLNLAGFYYKYKNIQVQSFRIPGPPTIFNASSAELYGLDADLELRPTSALTINATMNYTHSAFGSFPNAEFYAPCDLAHIGQGNCSPANAAIGAGYYIFLADAKGNSLPLAPGFTGSIAMNYEVPTRIGKVNLNGTYSYNGGFFTTPGHELHQDAFSRLGASIQLTTNDDRYFFRIWGANLTNSQDASRLNQLTSGPIIGLNAPRTYGITIGVKIK